MSLEKWVEFGWLRREPTSPDEIGSLLGVVERSLADAKVDAVSDSLPLSTPRFALPRWHCVPLAVTRAFHRTNVRCRLESLLD